MAIDTRAKRESSMNVFAPWRSRYPFGDGTIDQADRQTSIYHYGGVLASGGVVDDTSDVYPLIQGGSFAFPSGINYLRPLQVSYAEAKDVQEVTGKYGGSFDVAPRYENALNTEELSVRGYVGTAVGVFQTECSATVNTIDVDTYRFRLSKSWPLLKVSGKRSGAFDDEEKWQWGIPRYELEYGGWPMNDGPILRGDNLAISFDLDSLGTISFNNTLKIFSQGLHGDFNNGGRTYYRMSGVHQGTLTYAPGENDLSWLFIDAGAAADDPVGGSYTWTTTAEQLTGRGLLYSIALEFVPKRGGYLAFSARLRGDDA